MKTLKEIRGLQKQSSGWFKVNYEIGSVIVYKLQKYDFSPNWITLLRVIFFMIAGILIVKQQYFFGGILVALSYLTDMIDGQWAKLKNRCTKAGGLFDGIADKMLWLVVILSILFSNFSTMNSLIVIIILSLELMVSYSQSVYKYSFGSQESQITKKKIKEKGTKKVIKFIIRNGQLLFDHHTFFLIVTIFLILNIAKYFLIYELIRQLENVMGFLWVIIKSIKEEKKELTVKKGQ